MGIKLDAEEIHNFIIKNNYKILKGFVRTSEKLKLMCPEGHEIDMYWHSFKKGHRCKKCGRKICAEKNKLSYEQVFNYIKNEGYELLSETYNKAKDNLKIRCPEGHEFEMTYDGFHSGYRCPKCQKVHKYTYEEVYEEIRSMGMELLSNTYIDAHEKLEIRCKCGNKFYKNFNKIRYEPQCPECGIESRANIRKHSIEYVREYIEGYGYELLSNEYKNDTSLLLVRCPLGHEYLTNFDRFRSGVRCTTCGGSKGEEKIYDYLSSNNIPHRQQYKYSDLRGLGGGYLKFDFAVTNNREDILFLIEYQGRQHYEEVEHFGSSEGFAIRVYHDALKQAYCQDNNIPLLIIPFWDFNKIEQILQNTIIKYITDLPPNTAINT